LTELLTFNGGKKMKKFVLHKSSNRETHYGIPSSDYIDAEYLAAGTEGEATVPARAKLVLFSATADFYFILGDTVTVPAANIEDGTAGELNPVVRVVEPGDIIHLISPWTCVVTMAYYL